MSRVHALREARGEMVRVRLEILTAVVGKSDAELLACPLGGGWSAAEVLDHIRTAEGSLVKALGKLERGEPTRVPARGWYYRLPLRGGGGRARVPRPHPRGEGLTRQGARKARARGADARPGARLVLPPAHE